MRFTPTGARSKQENSPNAVKIVILGVVIGFSFSRPCLMYLIAGLFRK